MYNILIDELDCVDDNSDNVDNDLYVNNTNILSDMTCRNNSYSNRPTNSRHCNNIDQCNDNLSNSSHVDHNDRLNKRNRRRKRGGKPRRDTLKVGFNNVNRIKFKVTEIGSLLKDEHIDVFGITETFLKPHDTVSIEEYTWIGKNRVHKGGGGIGFFVSNNVDVIDNNVFNSNADDVERLWIKISVDDNGPIYLAVAYFPVEGTDPDLTNLIYNQLLADCIRIEDDNTADPRIIIMGDCNGRIGKEIPFCDPVINSNGKRLLDFRDDSGLLILNCSNICKGKFTWFRKDLKSAIDYMLCSPNVLQCTREFIVDDERQFHLGSDHNVLLLNCKIKPSNSKRNTKRDVHTKHVIWDIKPDQDWSHFKNDISVQFKDWKPNNYNNVDTLWDSWKSKIITTATNSIGTKEINSSARHWWDKDIDNCIKQRKAACKLHRQWSKGDKRDAIEGDNLWSDYQSKRCRVKSLIKEKIMQKRIDRSIQISQEGGPQCRKFWQSLRGKQCKQDVHCLKDPGSDEIIFDRQKMSQSVLHYWNTLGKMNRSLNDKEDSNSQGVKRSVVNIRTNDFNTIDDDYNCISDVELNIDVISDAIQKSKNNKSPGLDNISNELLKNGGKGMNMSILSLFQRLIQMNATPSEWNKGIIIPIFKKGDRKDLNNYRGITLSSCVSKIFNRIIADTISGFLENNNTLSEVQGGFRKKYRCEDHIFTLKNIASCRREEGKPTYMAFLDFRKAFDTVWRDGLLYAAWNIGIRGTLWKLIDNMYANVQAKVKFGSIETEFFNSDEGVKQGCVLSPILFCIYINEFTKLLRSHKLGIQFCNVQMGSLFWADDIVLLANDEHELQRMLDLAATFADRWKLSFNHDKSNVLIVGKRINPCKLWELGDSYISEVNSYKYLGVTFSRNLSDHDHINDVIKKGNRLIGYVKSIIDGQDDYQRVYYGDLLWKTLVLPTINYASSVWVPGSAIDSKRIESLQYQMARAILKASRNTPLECLLGDLGWQPISVIQNNLRIKYFNRLRQLDTNRWPNIVFEKTHSVYIIKNRQTSNCLRWKWYSLIHNVMIECGMDHIFKDNMYSRYWINKFKSLSINNSNNKWLNNALSKSSIKDYLLCKNKPSLENYLLCKLDFYGAALKFKARSNTLALNGRAHSWKPNIDINCPLCSNGIEDLRHFFFLCTALNDIRVDMFRKLEDDLMRNGLEQFWSLFISSNVDVKLCLILGLSDDALLFCDPLLQIFDIYCKFYLKRAWHARSTILNM